MRRQMILRGSYDRGYPPFAWSFPVASLCRSLIDSLLASRVGSHKSLV